MDFKQSCNDLGWKYQEKMLKEFDLPSGKVTGYICRELSELFYHYGGLGLADKSAEDAATQRLITTLENMEKEHSEGGPTLPIIRLAAAELKERLAM
jgi:hypothetical protein